MLTGCLPHWLVPTQAIETALANKLEQRRIKREQQSKSAAKEIEEFTGEFLSAARRCFTLIDKDGGGTLSKEEIVLSPRGSPADGTRRRRDVDVPRETSRGDAPRPRRGYSARRVGATRRGRDVDIPRDESPVAPTALRSRPARLP